MSIADTWRARRSPRLAELADLEGDPGLRTRLDAVIASRVVGTLENLRASFDDEDSPVFSSWVLHQLEHPPFVGGSAQPLLEYLIDTAKRLRDPRLVERAPEIIRQWTARLTPKPVRLALTTRLEKAVSVVAAIPVREATPDESKREAEWTQRLKPAATTKRTAADLLADIYGNPRDDAARLVYADFLLEQGDPRGELISLQMAGAGATNLDREKELLKKHGRQWLGPLATVVSWGKVYSRSRFARGFLSTADHILSAGKKLDVVIADPSWAVVEKLEGTWPFELMTRAPLHGLRSLQSTAVALEVLAKAKARFPNVDQLDLQNAEVDWDLIAAICPAVESVSFLFERGPTVEDVASYSAAARGRAKRLTFNRWVEHGERTSMVPFDDLVAGALKLPPTVPEIALMPPYTRWPPPLAVELRRFANGYTRLV